jgi:alanine dehydrogenase
MIIGIPKEIKEQEYRVGIAPEGVRALRAEGHRVIVEQSAGEGSAIPDREYQAAGAEISDKKTLFRESTLIVKVKEPLPEEYGLFREGQGLFTFLHLAANQELAAFLIKKKITSFAYETLEENGTTPILVPMSEIAGRMSPIIAAFYLQRIYGGRGTLLTGVHGGDPAQVLILGAGTVGMNALRISYEMGAHVTVINRGKKKLELIDAIYQGRVRTLTTTRDSITSEVLKADVVVGAVLVRGAKAPRLVSRELVAKMKKGAVIVDVAVDQGGCFDTTRPTTHTKPVYNTEGIIHYAVANMPGAYPRTSTFALTRKTLPYIKTLANEGIECVIRGNTSFQSALNICDGRVVHRALAESLSRARDELS